MKAPPKKRAPRKFIPPPLLSTETDLEGTYLIATIPIKTVSESNQREHWHKAAQRHQTQKLAVNLALNGKVKHLKAPYTVTLIRHGPRRLDAHDNLPTSFKYVTDQVAALLLGEFTPGRADSDYRIKWKFDQQKSPVNFVTIHIISDHNPYPE